MDTFKASLDWLTFTYKPERSHWGAALKLDTLQLSREKLPIDYFMVEFPSVADFIKEHGTEIRGRFNYNFGYQVGVRSNGSYNANTDFVVLAVMCTDTSSREYAVKQGVNVSVPGHYIPKFCELLGLEGDSDDSIALLFNFLRDHGCSASRIDLALLFNRDIKTIGKHINNALREELDGIPVVAKFATTATDGKRYNTEHYNLDMILSVGYRVKSSRGIEFRRWANQVLKDYLLKGYSINHRLQALERTVDGITFQQIVF